MSRIHYFQRYSSKENAVTNNTLLLLSQLYAENPELLENVFEDLVEESGLRIGPVFGQQIREEVSVPDGVLEQPSFRVLIETKLGDKPSLSQLKRHLEAFGDEQSKVLLILTGRAVSQEFQDRFSRVLSQYNTGTDTPVIEQWTTFESLIHCIREVIGDRHYDLADLVDDFQEYCGEMGLLPRAEYRMRAVPCGKSFQENMTFGVYYEPPGRAATPYEYLGIYKNKAILGIGKVAYEVEADVENGTVKVFNHDQDLEPDVIRRIRETVEAAQKGRGWDVSKDHHFIVLEEVYRTEYRKRTSGGMRGMQYFDLGKILDLGELPEVSEIAEQLREHTW